MSRAIWPSDDGSVMQLSEDQIRELAPDQKSVLAAQAISNHRFWNNPGLNESALWGGYGTGRGYDVRIDLANLGSSCNCPSRKSPCKHVLALLMLFASTPAAFQVTESPEAVDSWIQKRRLREQKSQQVSETKKPVDSVAQQKRMQEREAKIDEGLQQFSVWLDDLILNGIAELELRPFSYWDTQARRLVDAQAKGLASRVRRLAEIPRTSKDWPPRMLDELGRTRLLVHAAQRINSLSPELQSEVRQLIGWNLTQEALLESGELVADDWLIFGQQVEEEERFRTQRSWGIGLLSAREALFLQFAPGQQGFSEQILPGTVSSGTVRFYPGTTRQRAKFEGERKISEVRIDDLPALALISDFFELYATKLALSPWLAGCACLLKNVSLTRLHEQWYVRDIAGNGIPLTNREPFQMLAETGGKPFQMMGEWNGNALTPLSYLIGSEFQVCR